MNWTRRAWLTGLAAGMMRPAQAAEFPAETTQVLLVETAEWSAIQGRAEAWERKNGRWERIGPAWPVTVGRKGLAWGRGLFPSPADGPQKREGDGCAPTGWFELPWAFGTDLAKPNGLKLPYRPCTPTLRGVDDPASKYYNQIVDEAVVADKDWTSAEIMRREDGHYRYGVFVAHNVPAVPAGGSCIFLHLWGGPAVPTAGCTAMTEENLVRVLRWLDPACRPLLVQAPREMMALWRAQHGWR